MRGLSAGGVGTSLEMLWIADDAQRSRRILCIVSMSYSDELEL